MRGVVDWLEQRNADDLIEDRWSSGKGTEGIIPRWSWSPVYYSCYTSLSHLSTWGVEVPEKGA